MLILYIVVCQATQVGERATIFAAFNMNFFGLIVHLPVMHGSGYICSVHTQLILKVHWVTCGGSAVYTPWRCNYTPLALVNLVCHYTGSFRLEILANRAQKVWLQWTQATQSCTATAVWVQALLGFKLLQMIINFMG